MKAIIFIMPLGDGPVTYETLAGITPRMCDFIAEVSDNSVAFVHKDRNAPNNIDLPISELLQRIQDHLPVKEVICPSNKSPADAPYILNG